MCVYAYQQLSPLVSTKILERSERNGVKLKDGQGTREEKRENRKEENEPLLVASSSSATSTPDAGRCTYRTTLPRMKTFFTDDYSTQRNGYVSVFFSHSLCLSSFPLHRPQKSASVVIKGT